MKRLILLFLTFLLSGPLVADEVYRLHVDGLFCPYCAYGVEKELRKMEGVKSIEVSLEASEIIVTTKEGMALDEVAVRRAVRDGGFTLRGFEHVEQPQKSTTE
jgi:mercuric ion binding protein